MTGNGSRPDPERIRSEAERPLAQALGSRMKEMYASPEFGMFWTQYQREIARVREWASRVPRNPSTTSDGFALEHAYRDGFLEGVLALARMAPELQKVLENGVLPGSKGGNR